MGESSTIKLTDENFSTAMAGKYFQQVIDRGGVNQFTHLREVSSVETQNIIRENRDTLYSWGIFDVKDGLEISLPAAGDIYMSALVIDNDTFIVREEDFDKTGDIGTYQAYSDKPRTIRISHQQAVTDFVYVVLRTQTDATPEGDKKANGLQDAVNTKQGSTDVWKSRQWDWEAVEQKRQSYVPYLSEIVAKGSEGGYNERGKTDQFEHNFYSAIGWGGQLERYATYGTTPDFTEFGEDGAIAQIESPNIDYDRNGFWSYQVYGLDGYLHSNNSTLNNYNTKPNPDGTITLRFGSKEVFGTDENRVDKPDEGFSITTRFYNPKGSISPSLLNPSLKRYPQK
ncbi:DUF1254 domain-containing protein [Pleurocapsa sp. PCC 7319]|uniref:DUF1254 domain-containing protein n=1 Tax=Pleurocapsa sp. PCC 7319 TaxID=118161 RepID=UPI000346D435|nr:DUF1254 domain-containing protein [Pleurocapsa sp. PCC 7319]